MTTLDCQGLQEPFPFVLFILDCFEFINSFGDQVIYANRTGSAIIKFKFRTDNEDTSKTTIKCRYITPDFNSVTLIEKTGNSEPRRTSDSNVFGSRATVFTDSKEVNVVGIRLTDIRSDDPETFQCTSSFVLSNSATDSRTSDAKKLKVLGSYLIILNSLKELTL